MKTVCIYHRVDLDGWMSAAIVKHWFITNHQDGTYNIGNIDTNKVEGVFNNELIKDNETNSLTFLGYHYGDPIPDLSEYDKVIMCDVSFPKEEMLNLIMTFGINFFWIDHHQPKIDEVKEYTLRMKNVLHYGLTTSKGESVVSACELTWLFFFREQPMPEIVRLLGRYDCFGHKGTDEEQKVLEFQYGARAIITNYEEAYNWLFKCLNEVVYKNSDTTLIPILLHTRNISNSGKAIYQYLCTEAKQTYKNGFNIIFLDPSLNFPGCTVGDTFRRFICFNKERFNPINFGIDYHADGYDGAACFWYANDMWNFSLYNDNDQVDCSVIAKQYGGGGHKGAAGFSVDDLENII